MTAVLIAAVGTALSIIGLIRALRPPPISAASVLETARRPGRGHSTSEDRTGVFRSDGGRSGTTDRRMSRPDAAIARQLVNYLEDRSRVPAEVTSWCAAADRAVEEVAAQMVLGALCGVLVPFMIVAIAIPAGVRLPVVLPVWAGVLSILGGAIAPLVALRSEARAARRGARAVVSSFLDLVTLCLAGGMGIEGALHASAGVAQDRLSARLRQALSAARDRGETPWQALAALGRQLRIDELTELSAAVALAGTEGARIRSTLSAKSASIRRHQLSEAEAEANTITERLFLPGMLLLLGFLLFVGYPAVSKILGGF